MYLVRGGGCTWSRGGGAWCLLPGGGGVPGPGGVCSRGVCLVWGVYLVLGGVLGLGGAPGPGGMYLVPGGVPGPRGLLQEGVSAPGGGVCSRRGCLLQEGVSTPGVSALGGCTWSRGVSAPGGYLVWRGVCLLLGACQVLPPVNRIRRLKKHNLAPTSLQAVTRKHSSRMRTDCTVTSD